MHCCAALFNAHHWLSPLGCRKRYNRLELTSSAYRCSQYLSAISTPGSHSLNRIVAGSVACAATA
eukprot:scaffold215174_cov33-Prasinocladus_malaysianus.AAC.1